MKDHRRNWVVNMATLIEKTQAAMEDKNLI